MFNKRTVIDAISNFIHEENDVRYVKEEELEALEIDYDGMEYLKKVLNKNGISFQKKMIEIKDRPTRVADYCYGEIKTNEIENLDKPAIATIVYEDDRLEEEDYTELDKLLEEEIIPNYLQKKVRGAKKFGNIKEYPSIQLNHLVSLQLSEAEMEHVLNRLNELGIRVCGYDSTLVNEFENYDYYRTYKNSKLPEFVGKEEIMKDLEEYQVTRNIELRNKIVSDNIRLVKAIAYPYARVSGFPQSEIESYGYEGLIYAVEHFRSDMGCTFSTYAYPTIRGFILKGLPELHGFERGSFFWNYMEAKSTIENEYGATIYEDEKIVTEIVYYMINIGAISERNGYAVLRRIHLNNPIFLGDGEVENSIPELVDDTEVFSQVESHLLQDSIKEALETLTAREAKVIYHRFFIGQTLETCGKEFNFTAEKIRQIEAKALRKLRHPSRSRRFRDYCE